MKKRLVAILMATTMVLSLMGCGSEKSSGTDKEAASTATSQTVVSSEATPTSEAEDENTGLLPYTGEEITFSFFWYDTGADYSDETLPIVEAIQEKLGNIKLDLEILPLNDYYTKIPLLMAGGEIPDIMIVSGPYDYITTYGENDIFLDFEPLMEQYMPNLYAYSQDMYMFDTLRDAEGHLYAIPMNINSEDRIQNSWFVNTTLLDELEIEIPETQEEFLEACRKVKAEKGITPIQRRGFENLRNCVGFMYKNQGDKALQYYPEERKWDFGPTREDSELKDYLTYMNILWEEGLIDHEINTQTGDQVFDYLYSGEFAFTHEYNIRFSHTQTDDYVPFESEADFEVAVMPTPKGSGRNVNIITTKDGTCSWAAFANAKTEHPELLAACIDLMFSDEVTALNNFGIEGVSYEVDEDGQMEFTDSMSVAYNYFSGDSTMSDLGYWRSPWNRAFGVVDQRSSRMIQESEAVFEGVNNIMSMLDSGELQPLYNYSYPTLSVEESTEVSDIIGPVNTYLNECIVKFIMGDMNLDTEWDTFMEKLQGYGDMERVCEILNSKEMPAFSGNWR